MNPRNACDGSDDSILNLDVAGYSIKARASVEDIEDHLGDGRTTSRQQRIEFLARNGAAIRRNVIEHIGIPVGNGSIRLRPELLKDCR